MRIKEYKDYYCIQEPRKFLGITYWVTIVACSTKRIAEEALKRLN